MELILYIGAAGAFYNAILQTIWFSMYINSTKGKIS